MADEVTLTASLKYDDGDFDEAPELAVAGELFSVTTKKFVKSRMTVTTAELAIPLGNLTTLGWAAFKNLNATNFVEIRTGTGGTKMIKIPVGGLVIFYFGSGVTAPFIIADTASCDVAYLIAAI
jgi:hypothetical protein